VLGVVVARAQVQVAAKGLALTASRLSLASPGRTASCGSRQESPRACVPQGGRGHRRRLAGSRHGGQNLQRSSSEKIMDYQLPPQIVGNWVRAMNPGAILALRYLRMLGQ
jgi:hypothetical protein